MRPICRWVVLPLQATFKQVPTRIRSHVFRYITSVFLIGLSPQRTNSAWTYSNYSPEESCDRYDVLNFSILETYAASVILSMYHCMLACSL